MFGDFFLLEREDGGVSRAERLAFGETSGRNETWLRDLLFDHPELLPIRDIDPSFGPLVPLCKELRTEAGRLDLAFINSHGQLTLVECKLWRNPQARREVVAQVLDYARAISRWSYSDLQREVTRARGGQGNVPFDLVRAHNPMLAEHQFVDAAYTAMRSGRFLLLIAGDGIREDVGAIADLINRNAAAGFAFGLVEVALYGFEDGSLVVQPRVIAKTQIIERTTFSLTHGGRAELVSFDPAPDSTPVADGSGAVRDANNLGESPKQAEYRAWWAPVLNTVFDDPDQEPPKLYWPNNVRAALPWRQTWILAYRLGGAGGVVGVSTAGRGTEYRPMIEALTAQRDEIISELPTGSQYTKFDRGGDFAYRCVRPVSEFTSDDEARDWISRTMNAFVNVFRPRLKSLPLG